MDKDRERSGLITGRFAANERGFGFVRREPPERDIYVAPEDVNGALDQDTVLCKPFDAEYGPDGARGDRPAGKIIRVLEPAVVSLVGTLDSYKQSSFVMPDDKKLTTAVAIARSELNGARKGQKVLVEILSRGTRDDGFRLTGKVLEVIGYAGEAGVDLRSIVLAHGFATEFPEDVLSEAEAIPDRPDGRKFRGRRDLRALRLFTIDGADSKDLDDAVSIELLKGGIGTDGAVYRLGVHIADVAAYVREGTALDAEAGRRGTSLYFADRVVPMLPQKLSNGVCSLHPHVDRLALSVFMDIDARGDVLSHEVCESVINSAERMTYDNVYRILVESDAELRARYAHITGDLEAMRELTLILRGRRERRGAVDFAFKEARIALDENGAPISVEAAEQTVANRIIEEFMIVCNETVAERFGGEGQPFVFRTHDKPDPFKLEAFAVFAAELGFPLRAGVDARGPVTPGDLQAVVRASEGTPYQKAIAAVMLRAMAKAGYTAGNIGHFGLASGCYCHFTSPIRRYPDLLVHRIIKATLRHKTAAQTSNPVGLPRAERERYKALLPGLCEHCSERERAADEVEYETDALKKAEYMKAFVGQRFDGTVSGVTAFGVFVELDNTVEGLMRLGDLYDDYYIYDEARHTVVGKNTGRRYGIGDPVSVDLVRVSVEARQIDFMPSDLARKAAASMQAPIGGKAGKAAKPHSGAKAARPGKPAKSGKTGKKRHGGGPRIKRGRR